MRKLILLLLIPYLSFAQNTSRKFENFKEFKNTLEINVSDGQYILKSYSDKIIETTFLPKGEAFNPTSHAVVLNSKDGISKISDSGNSFNFATSGMVVTIQKFPFKISYIYKGKEILSEKTGYNRKDSTEVLDFNISKDEILYGGGARVLGMNRRGNRLKLYNQAHYGYGDRAELMNFCIPLVMSSKMYAVHFDNPSIGYLDLDSKKENTLAYETISGRKTYQVIVGDSWEDLILNYTDLTGRQPLPALWTLGNFSSRFGYRNQEEVENTIRKFEENKIPVDAIILDLYWFGKTIQYTLGNLEWDKDNFPNPDKMIADLNKKNIKTILITEPFILTTSKKWQEAVDKKILATDTQGNPAKFDFYFGNSGIVDIFKPEGKTWFWNNYKNLINQGVGGLWGDLGEPEALPSRVLTAGGKADEIHNIYGHNWAKLIADGYKKEFPTVRPFILMRAGYSGSQRFGMVPWSGDVSRSWEGLSGQIEVALQMGMQGLGYMHSDLGGFAGDYFDNELYLRWLQYGVFQPIFRPHAGDAVASEVARKDIETMAKAKKLVELRYQMLPYNYTLSYQNSQSGIPLMRPLFFEEPYNLKLQTIADEYLWGKDFLIKPITKAGITETEIYFPNNSNWFDFYTGKKYEAGTTQTIKVNENNIPTFVRGNAFYPMTKLLQNTSNYSSSELDLYFYCDGKASSEREFYFDDGKTPNANEDTSKHEILNCSTEFSKKTVEIILESKTSSQELLSKGKKGEIYLYNFSKKPKEIKINGTLVTSIFDKKTKILQLNYSHSGYKTNIIITL
jgi:oligosaccharide 4-alpha-D-glucosyltransferase